MAATSQRGAPGVLEPVAAAGQRGAPAPLGCGTAAPLARGTTAPLGGCIGAGKRLDTAPHAVRSTGAGCVVCSKMLIASPHRAPCGHVACYACWLPALALFRCPSCKAPVKRSQLTKEFFK